MIINIKGERYGKLTALAPSGSDSSGALKWDCICDCGNSKNISGTDLRRGKYTGVGVYNGGVVVTVGSGGGIVFREKCTSIKEGVYLRNSYILAHRLPHKVEEFFEVNNHG